MKIGILCSIGLLLATLVQAQAPQGFTYQAVARTAAGDVLVNKPLKVRLSLLDGSATGTAQYVESQDVTTNGFGLFTLTVGAGTASKGTLSGVTWGSGAKFLGVEVAFDGTTNYQSLGATQLQSVPFALYAANGGTPGPQGPKGDTGAQGAKGDKGDSGSGASYTAGNGITITGSSIAAKDDSPTNEIQALSLNGQTLSLSSGGSVTLPSSSGPWLSSGTNINTATNATNSFITYAVAMGNQTSALGKASTTMGSSTTANGSFATAMGANTQASADYSTAMGYQTEAHSPYSTAMGYQTEAAGQYATVMGANTKTTSFYATAMGLYNQDVAGALLMIGNGSASSANNVMTVLRNGSVGIGTSAPKAPLHVAGSATVNYNTLRFFSYGRDFKSSTSESNFTMGLLVENDIVTNNSIVSAQTVTTSDARIKRIIGKTDNQQDLQTLRQLEVTNYTFKDVVKLGNTPQKKVIAQQVETVYPQAVRKRTDFIPDVYAVADVEQLPAGLSLTLAKPHGLTVGETIKLIHPEKGEFTEQVERIVDKNTFTISVETIGATSKLFVYGRRVDDFRVVDYEALSVLTISATQAMLQRLELAEKENRLLQKELHQLDARLVRLEENRPVARLSQLRWPVKKTRPKAVAILVKH